MDIGNTNASESGTVGEVQQKDELTTYRLSEIHGPGRTEITAPTPAQAALRWLRVATFTEFYVAHPTDGVQCTVIGSDRGEETELYKIESFSVAAIEDDGTLGRQHDLKSEHGYETPLYVELPQLHMTENDTTDLVVEGNEHYWGTYEAATPEDAVSQALEDRDGLTVPNWFTVMNPNTGAEQTVRSQEVVSDDPDESDDSEESDFQWVGDTSIRFETEVTLDGNAPSVELVNYEVVSDEDSTFEDVSVGHEVSWTDYGGDTVHGRVANIDRVSESVTRCDVVTPEDDHLIETVIVAGEDIEDNYYYGKMVEYEVGDRVYYWHDGEYHKSTVEGTSGTLCVMSDGTTVEQDHVDHVIDTSRPSGTIPDHPVFEA